MKSATFVNAMGEISEKYIMEAVSYKPEARSSHHLKHHFPASMIAAVLALLLMGAGFVAVIYGNSIQNWFSHYWEIITGQAMNDAQTAVLNRLSQNIGLSQTDNGVTVTVDSATVGDDIFFLLVRVEGVQFSNKYGYEIKNYSLQVTPDLLLDPDTMGAFGLEYCGLDGDGTALFLVTYDYTSRAQFMRDTRPLEVELNLKNLVQKMNLRDSKLLAEGEWDFTFSLDRSQFPEIFRLPDTKVTVFDSGINQNVEIAISNIEVTSTGLRFQYDQNDMLSVIRLADINAILEGSISVSCSNGSGIREENGNSIYFSGHWHTPISLDEIYAIQIGDTQILVH